MRIKLGAPLYLTEIYEALDLRYREDNRRINYISTDTRELYPGDLFIAIKGDKFNGNDYLTCAKGLGAISLGNDSTADIYVDNTIDALSKIARYHISKLKGLKYRIAITGSVGKTTTKEFTKRILEGGYKTLATTNNYNNEIGVPLTILSAPLDTEILLIEVGMNSFGELSRLSHLICPNLAVITNIGTAHIGNLGTRAGIARAKLEILDGMENGVLLIPDDEPLLVGARLSRRVGFTNNAEVKLKLTNDGINYNGININISRVSMVYNEPQYISALGFALAIADEVHLTEDIIKAGASKIDGSCIRQRVIKVCNFNIIDDSYNASLESIIAAIKLVDNITNRYSLVIGDVLELGKATKYIHEEIGRIAAKTKARLLYFFGDNRETMMSGALEAGRMIDDIRLHTTNEELANAIINEHSPCEYVLFKASHRVNLGAAIKMIQEHYGDD